MGLFKKKPEGTAEKWLNKGRDFYLKGYFKEAFECFDKALSIDPSYEKALEKFLVYARLVELFKDQESAFIGEFPRETKTLSEKGVETVFKFLEPHKESILIFGDFSRMAQIMPELRRNPRDIDFRLDVDEEEAKRIAQDLMKKLRDIGEKVRINPEKPAIIESFKEGKWQRAVGIHHIGEQVDISGLPIREEQRMPTEAAIDTYAMIKTSIESAKKDPSKKEIVKEGEVLFEKWKSLWSDEIDFDEKIPKIKEYRTGKPLREPPLLEKLKISPDEYEKHLKFHEDVELDMNAIERMAKVDPTDPYYQDVKNPKEFKLRHLALKATIEGEYEKAIGYANKGLEINPKSVYLFYVRGRSKGDVCRFKEGIEDLNKAIKLNPKFTEAIMERGYIKQKMGDIRGAEKDYKKAKNRGFTPYGPSDAVRDIREFWEKITKPYPVAPPERVERKKEIKKTPPPAPKTIKGRISKTIYDTFPKLKRKKKRK